MLAPIHVEPAGKKRNASLHILMLIFLCIEQNLSMIVSL